MYLKKLSEDLYKCECVLFGKFIVKTGRESPVYINLRNLFPFPNVMENVSELFLSKILVNLKFDAICGVPYTAIPIASYIAIKNQSPLIVKRKEEKNYGTKQLIEGNCSPGQRVLIIEDIISSGTSILETVISLKEQGLIIEDVVVVLDREQGGIENLKKFGIKVHSLLTISGLLENLVEKNYLDRQKSDDVLNWIKNEKVSISNNIEADYFKLNSDKKNKSLTYGQKANLTENKVAKSILELIEKKKSNLCVSIDEHHCEKILKITELVAPYVIMVKLHHDLIEDFNLEFIEKLKNLAKVHNFLIFEDRKFSDIGNTVAGQFSHSYAKINTWANIINCHILSGEGVIKSLKEHSNLNETALLIVAQLSTKGNLISSSYTSMAKKFAEINSDFVIGFVCQQKLSENSKFLHFVPGVNSLSKSDNLDQTYCSPSDAIKKKGADIIIVGRGITKSENPALTAKQYQEEGYNAYLENISDEK